MTHRHSHQCACGTVLICAAEPDKCAVIEPFACPACLDAQQADELDQLFYYFTTTKEPKRHEKH